MSKNHQIILTNRPIGFPKNSDFELIETEIPKLKKNTVLLKTKYLSVDPYMRGRMSAFRGSYAPPIERGEPIVGEVVGEVIESKDPNFKIGEIARGQIGWQTFGVAKGETLTKVDPSIAPISTSLGILGMPGLTAYFGLLEIGQPKTSETVLVSGAAGAVGSIVGQIAKIRGCKAIGIAGSDEKIDYLINELGFDSAFNYKTTENYRHKLRDLVPQKTDVYFDNVGGEITDAVFPNLNLGARIVICGQISQYNLEQAELGPRLFGYFIVKRLRMQGFLVYDFVDRHRDAISQMAEWLIAGKLKYRETITDGFENAPSAFIGMMKGQNIGKQLVKVSD